MSRFMMQSYGQLKPLSFDPQGEVRPLLASASTRWAGIPFEVHDLPPLHGPFENGPPPGERGMLIPVSGTRTSVIQLRRRELQVVSSPGMVGFMDGSQVIPLARATGQSRAVVFNVPSLWHERLLAEGGPENFSRVAPIPPNEIARALALAMCAEVEAGASTGTLFAESLSTALFHYVLEHTPAATMRVRGSLTDGQRRRLTRHIDDRLQEDVTLTELAALVGLRPRHFSTLFRRAFGFTPHQFLIERRLERATQLLASTQADIAEVALCVGFSSQSHFAVSFRKRYGVSPRRYALRLRSTAGC